MKNTFKKLLASALAASTVFGLATFASAESTVKYGDINADEIINSSDALAVLQHSVGTETLEGSAFAAADVDADGIVNSSDALLILQYSVGSINSFPAEETSVYVPETSQEILDFYSSAVAQAREEVPGYKLVVSSKATDVEFSGSIMYMVSQEEIDAMKEGAMTETSTENKILQGTATAFANLPEECSITDPSKFKSITCTLLEDGNLQVDITFKDEKSPKAGSPIVTMFGVPDKATYEEMMLEEMGVAGMEDTGMSMSIGAYEYKNAKITCVINPETNRLVSYSASYDTFNELITEMVLGFVPLDMITETTIRAELNYSEFVYE